MSVISYGAPTQTVYVARQTLTDAQIKALPTTDITLVATPGAGFRIKPISMTLALNAAAGAYTNIDATYADVAITVGGKWLALPLVNDNTLATPLDHVEDFFGLAQTRVLDVQFPYMDGINGAGAAGTRDYIDYLGNGAMGSIADMTNVPLLLATDNSASGAFTGGNAANTLLITVYYTLEKTA